MISDGMDLYLVYRVLKMLTTPFEKWEAFKTGVIDKEGTVLVKSEARSETQKRSFRSFDLMVRNMKRILGKLPGGKSQFASFAAALFLIKESNDANEDNFTKFLNEEYSVELHEAIANSIGAVGVYMFHDPEELYIDNESVQDKRDQADDNPYWEDKLHLGGNKKDENDPDELKPSLHRNHKANIEVINKKHHMNFKKFMKMHGKYHGLKEEAPVNNVGGGAIQGVNDGTKKSKVQRRKQINTTNKIF